MQFVLASRSQTLRFEPQLLQTSMMNGLSCIFSCFVWLIVCTCFLCRQRCGDDSHPGEEIYTPSGDAAIRMACSHSLQWAVAS